MTRPSWATRATWGELWLLLCVGAAIIAVKSGDLAGWWLLLILAAVLGFFLLNALERLVTAAEQHRPRIYDRERDP